MEWVVIGLTRSDSWYDRIAAPPLFRLGSARLAHLLSATQLHTFTSSIRMSFDLNEMLHDFERLISDSLVHSPFQLYKLLSRPLILSIPSGHSGPEIVISSCVASVRRSVAAAADDEDDDHPSSNFLCIQSLALHPVNSNSRSNS